MSGAGKPLRLDTAMVLSAGLGTRMAALNGNLPKPLITLNGQALIDRVLDRIAAAGVERAVVNVHHHADLIERHLKGRQTPLIEFSDERAARLDTGGGVKKALPRLGPDPFLIHNADSVWIESVGSNLARLCDSWEEEEMDCLLLLAPASIRSCTGSVVIDALPFTAGWRCPATQASRSRFSPRAPRARAGD